jgi:hypothetical protein
MWRSLKKGNFNLQKIANGNTVKYITGHSVCNVISGFLFSKYSLFSDVQIFILLWSRRTYFAITLSCIDVLIMTNTVGLKLVCAPSEMMMSFDMILSVHHR